MPQPIARVTGEHVVETIHPLSDKFITDFKAAESKLNESPELTV